MASLQETDFPFGKVGVIYPRVSTIFETKDDLLGALNCAPTLCPMSCAHWV